MSEDGEENGTETDDATEDFPDDLEVQIHEAILAREKTGDVFPDRNAVDAMEEPLHRLTGAAVLFSDITTEAVPVRSCACAGSLSWPRRCSASP